MNIIFQINGGLGKSVMATAVCKSIKAKYPESKLIVISAHPDVFINNPNVDRCLRFNELKYFYKEYIDNQEFMFIGQEPYQTDEYSHNTSHLTKIWCDLHQLPFVQEHGELFLTKREMDFYSRKYTFNKPILVLQTSGNAGDMMYNWGRDIPLSLVNSIVKKFGATHDIVHIKDEKQMSYDGVIPFTDNIRAVAAIISMSDKRIFMDSCCQHISAALGLKSNVFWIATSPKVFGYESNNNILANVETKSVSLQNAFLRKYELVPDIIDFPYNDDSEIFNINEVLNSII